MIWAILAMLGVPLWLCAAGILALVYRNKSLRQRHGDIPVRVQRAGNARWTRGHAIWVSDVFAWRGSPAAWNEDLLLVTAAQLEAPGPEDLKKLHRLGDNPAVITLVPDKGDVLRVAVANEHRAAILGPYGTPVSGDRAQKRRTDGWATGQPDTSAPAATRVSRPGPTQALRLRAVNQP